MWYKKFNQKDNFLRADPDNLSVPEIERLLQLSKGALELLNFINDRFSNIEKQLRVGSTFEDMESLFKYGPYVFIVIWGETFKEHQQKIIKLQQIINHKADEVNINFNIYIQGSGFDIVETDKGGYIPSFWILDNGNLYKAESAGITSFAQKNITFPDNLSYLIKLNMETDLYIKRASHIIQEHHSDIFENIKRNIMSENIDLKSGIQMLRQQLSRREKDTSVVEFSDDVLRMWYWKEYRGGERIEEQLEQAMGDLFESQPHLTEEQRARQYEYFIDMDPRGEGGGKFIDVDTLKKAYNQWGDFDVIVRYNDGRLSYPASDIIKFLSYGIDDDRAYAFFNQMGGIRDMFVVRSKA